MPIAPAARRFAALLLVLCCLGLAPSPGVAEALGTEEQVLFLPGIARPMADGRLEVDIHAWVYERERRRGLNRALARYLGLDLKAMTPAAQLRFNDRAALFHTESEDDKAVDIAFDGSPDRATLPRTGKDGRSDARVAIAASADMAQEWVRFHAVLTPAALLHRFRGQALVVPAEGLSVISDIDDTVKHTQVRDRREMLLNTFARRFEAAPGMAAHYRALAQQPGTRFHYLSASPIQLYPPLADFLRSADFPAGSMHLRESTHWRTLIPSGQDSRAHKLQVIERLLADFPLRRFLLVGDSGESDPEIYAQVLRSHPRRVAGIVIRDVTGEDHSAARYASTFEGIDPALWHILPRAGGAWPAALR